MKSNGTSRHFYENCHPMKLSDNEFGDYVPKEERLFFQEIQICEADLDAVKGSKKWEKQFIKKGG